MNEKKRKDKTKNSLSSMQEVKYQHDFKLADQAGGYSKKVGKH